MSYSFEIKKAMFSIKENVCCKKAELYGFLLYNGGACGDTVSFSTGHSEYIERYSNIIKKYCQASFEFVSLDGEKKLYETDEATLDNVKRFIGCADFARFDSSLLESDCCVSAFIRGAFVACGFISEPEKTFHADFSVSDSQLADGLNMLLVEGGLEPKLSVRKDKRVLYFKTADKISDFLAFVGLPEFAFEFTNAGIERNVRNDVNRAVNCENANIDKTLAAVEIQLTAIQKLKAVGYPKMTDALIELAELRLEDTYISLAALGHMLSTPLSKSGVFHRMNKIISLANDLEQED